MFYLSTAQKGIHSPFDPIIVDAAQRYGVDIALIKAIISKESSWNPTALHIDNPLDPQARSYGLMQLVWKYFKMPDGGPVLDPAANINIGTELIAGQLQRRPTMELAIAAYNAGTGRSDVDLAQRLAANTNNVANHVNDVLEYYGWFWQNDPLIAGAGPGPDPTAPPGTDPPWVPPSPSPVTPNQMLLILGLTALGILLVGMLRRP